jgi:hypothetical protein
MRITHWQGTPWRRCRKFLTFTMLLLLLVGFPLSGNPQEPISPPRPPITIVLKGGAGIILVDKTWTNGGDLCWESRGYRGCILRTRVSYVQRPGLPDATPGTQF